MYGMTLRTGLGLESTATFLEVFGCNTKRKEYESGNKALFLL